MPAPRASKTSDGSSLIPFKLVSAKLSVRVDSSSQTQAPQPTSSASRTLRSPSAPTVRVRSRPEVTTKHPSVHVQTSGGRSRPPFKFVRAQSSRPNPPSVHARPRPSLRPTASISGHRSGSFTTRGHDQTRPAFASVRVVRSRPPFAFVHDQRSRPNTTSVHDQTSFPSSAPRPPAVSVHTTGSHVWCKHLKEGPFALRGCSVCEGVGGFCSAACSSQHTPRVHE